MTSDPTIELRWVDKIFADMQDACGVNHFGSKGRVEVELRRIAARIREIVASMPSAVQCDEQAWRLRVLANELEGKGD